MTKEKSTVPRLRFPGFTDAWKQRKLGEVAVVVMGQSPDSKNYTNNPLDNILVQGNADLKNGNVEPRVWTTQITKIAEKGDIIVSVRAPVGDVAKTRYKVVLGRGVAGIKGNDFIYQTLIRMKQFGYWMKLSTGSTFESINSGDIKSSLIPLPSLPEQEAIGNFFSDLDQLITLHQRKLDDVKELKKALLQKMFPKGNGNDFPELRFPEFTDAWKQRKLGEVAEKISQKNLDRQYVETFTNSAEFGIISQRDFFEKNISSLDNISGYYIVSPDDFVYNPRISNLAPVGPIKRNKLGRVGVMSPLYTIFRFSDIHLDFVEKYFDTTIWHRYMELNGDSGARSDRFAIKDSVFKGLPIPLPTLPEQEAIGSFFSDLDQLITLHQRQLDHLKLLKKALLQQMFI
ncbi:restriction endonuclease subunit S [Streptococcus suis]|uniref:restriction endonuclease subunit S n=1 Tax=Streptococcus suis TaxID=1307 RepID=UPI002AAC4991|nr:restriction endonuclease subunit S [Streptococcus suis]QZT29775.1 restriction endonuclease subunit S [Streptococcus suis]HEM6242561.1 restriction endonuclease subunit S [Streptococcus suis]